MKENKIENLIWIIFTIVGTICVIIGIALFGSVFNYANKVDTVGTITEDLLFLIFPGIGLIFLIIGGTGILVRINKRKLEKELKENGELIYANYNETILNTSYYVNGKSPYNIICEWNNPLDNKKYIFKSKNIWINPETIIKEKNIKQFPVYIDKNKKKYVIDTDNLTENIVDLR